MLMCIQYLVFWVMIRRKKWEGMWSNVSETAYVISEKDVAETTRRRNDRKSYRAIIAC